MAVKNNTNANAKSQTANNTKSNAKPTQRETLSYTDSETEIEFDGTELANTGVLWVGIPLTEDPQPSDSGKTLIGAKSGRWIDTGILWQGKVINIPPLTVVLKDKKK